MQSFTRCFVLTAFVLLISGNVTDVYAQPIALHQQNPHYFQYKGKPLVLITSAEHYGAVLNLDFQYKKYLEELASKGMNMTRTFSGVYCEPPGAFNISKNTLAPVEGKYITPWARSNTAGYRNGGNRFDLTQWDEDYFTRLKDFVSLAQAKNVIVEFTLFCPFYEDTMWILSPMHPGNNVNSTPVISRNDVYTLDKNGMLLDIQKKLVKKLVEELNPFDNVIFEICNEPYFGGVMMDWQHAIADVIVETEKSLPNKHLISQNIANGSAVVTDPHPAVSVFNFHYAYPPVVVSQNFALNKVIGDNETGFRGVSDTTYRYEGWRFILAGGGLYNNLDYSFTPGNEEGNYKYPATQPGGGSAALRTQLRYLKNFIDRFDYIRMQPDSTLFGASASSTPRYNALSETGKQYALYFIDDTLRSLNLNIPAGRYDITWLHPATGKYEKSRAVRTTTGTMRLTVPPHKQDIALRIVRK